MLFLDFEKASDRLDRAWIERCRSPKGLWPGLQRWGRILYAGTSDWVSLNGWHTDLSTVTSGVFQDSCLSPLLY